MEVLKVINATEELIEEATGDSDSLSKLQDKGRFCEGTDTGKLQEHLAKLEENEGQKALGLVVCPAADKAADQALNLLQLGANLCLHGKEVGRPIGVGGLGGLVPSWRGGGTGPRLVGGTRGVSSLVFMETWESLWRRPPG
ncbi:UNVERIFIED_CONTAM: hypothetical protein FKN15_002552 [Acipenser sinensis]